MQEIHVGAGTLDIASGDLKKVKSELESIMNSLNREANNATSGWSGQSASSFNSMWNRLSGAMNNLVLAVEDTALNLTSASDMYEEADRNVMKSK